jgi:hypothetical protein
VPHTSLLLIYQQLSLFSLPLSLSHTHTSLMLLYQQLKKEKRDTPAAEGEGKERYTSS